MSNRVCASVVSAAVILAIVSQVKLESLGRDLTTGEARAIEGGQLQGGGPFYRQSCCQINPACEPTYYTNACNDPVRNTQDLCNAQSISTGNPAQCVASRDPTSGNCQNSNQVGNCIINRACSWDAGQNVCNPTNNQSGGGDNVTMCQDTC